MDSDAGAEAGGAEGDWTSAKVHKKRERTDEIASNMHQLAVQRRLAHQKLSASVEPPLVLGPHDGLYEIEANEKSLNDAATRN
eukprot:CAMPEP_0184484236 /NCGR_PEP_ID=MMETSP0113_2-20130426/5964_1 /TAXON_ID=91329 /ORGANISM="Norrisiella sphaerica, Strain BC52" /LENGTH=82 /DNA_ID=CAMNT_0026865139 /DNA_START=191 /DNA_END=436 /DNA_ORIENTATION=+